MRVMMQNLGIKKLAMPEQTLSKPLKQRAALFNIGVQTLGFGFRLVKSMSYIENQIRVIFITH